LEALEPDRAEGVSRDVPCSYMRTPSRGRTRTVP